MTLIKTTTKTLAAVTLAAATLGVPALASANPSYVSERCANKDTEGQLLGGVVGGTLGSVLGKEIAGRGNNTEGAIIGALIGGIAGAAIGDEAVECDRNQRRGYSTGYRTTTDYHRPASVTNIGYHPTSSYGHSSHRRTDYRTRGYDRGYDRRDSLRRIDYRIDELRRERAELKSRVSYEGYSRRTQYRLDSIARELDGLKDYRKRVERRSRSRSRSRSSSYSTGYRTTRGHYHGSNVCYSDH